MLLSRQPQPTPVTPQYHTYSQDSTGLLRMLEGLQVEPQNLTAGQPGLESALAELFTLSQLQNLRRRSQEGSPGNRTPLTPTWHPVQTKNPTMELIPTESDRFPGFWESHGTPEQREAFHQRLREQMTPNNESI